MEARNYLRFGALACLVWAVFVAIPFWWVFVTAFKPPTAVNQGATYLPFVDFQPTLDAFREAFSGIRGDFVSPFLRSSLIAITATASSVLLGSMAAYALVRFEFRIKLLAGLLFAAISIGGFVVSTTYLDMAPPHALILVMAVALAVSIYVNSLNVPGPVLGNNDVTFWFVSQRMFPPIVSAFALFLIYAEAGKQGVALLDTFWGLVLAYTAFGLPFAVWLMRDFFTSVPIEIEEAALVDDVSRVRIFFQIVLPISQPGLVATSLIILAFIWNEFLFALLLTSSKWQTLPIVLAGQNSSRGDEWWAISVATLVAIAPMIVVAAALGRMMQSGLLSGSIK